MTARSRGLLRRRALAAGFAIVSAAMANAKPQSPADPTPAQESGVATGAPQAFAAQLPQRRELTLAEAIAIAQRRYPGRVVQAQTVQLGNGAVHEIEIIGNDGLVHRVRVDARTGAVN